MMVNGASLCQYAESAFNRCVCPFNMSKCGVSFSPSLQTLCISKGIFGSLSLVSPPMLLFFLAGGGDVSWSGAWSSGRSRLVLRLSGCFFLFCERVVIFAWACPLVSVAACVMGGVEDMVWCCCVAL